jgi:hypothetical protein
MNGKANGTPSAKAPFSGRTSKSPGRGLLSTLVAPIEKPPFGGFSIEQVSTGTGEQVMEETPRYAIGVLAL